MLSDHDLARYFGPVVRKMSPGHRACFGQLVVLVHELGLDWWQTHVDGEVARFGRKEAREYDADFVLGVVRGTKSLKISMNGRGRIVGVTQLDRELLTINLLDQAAAELKKSKNRWPALLKLNTSRDGYWPRAETAIQPNNGQTDFLIDLDAGFPDRVKESVALSSGERQRRLSLAPKKPKPRVVMTNGFYRNPDVVAEVLSRANGKCFVCKKTPFMSRDGSPYLEVHHKLQLAHGGDDTVDNAVALCPNCHRWSHHGKDAPTIA